MLSYPGVADSLRSRAGSEPSGFRGLDLGAP